MKGYLKRLTEKKFTWLEGWGFPERKSEWDFGWWMILVNLFLCFLLCICWMYTIAQDLLQKLMEAKPL